jgi:hypothetical protein
LIACVCPFGSSLGLERSADQLNRRAENATPTTRSVVIILETYTLSRRSAQISALGGYDN